MGNICAAFFGGGFHHSGGMFRVVMAIAFILLIVWGVKRLTEKRPPSDASAIIDRRLARGEISLEEYETLKKALC